MEKIFLTELKAIDPIDGQIKTWCGPRIEALTWGMAKWKIKDRGYLKIVGELIEEQDCNGENRINYQLN